MKEQAGDIALRDMVFNDLPQICDIERRSYDFPWGHGIFRDCMLAGHHCIVMERMVAKHNMSENHAPENNVHENNVLANNVLENNVLENKAFAKNVPGCNAYAMKRTAPAAQAIGYGIMSVGAGEAHILNLCVDLRHRAHGRGEQLLDEMLSRLQRAEVREVFLEVRPSNSSALSLYRKKGFYQVDNRRAYYPMFSGDEHNAGKAHRREDAAVLTKKLTYDCA